MRCVLIVAAVALCGGCSLFHDELPGVACVNNNDCFVSQGEVCNPTTLVCEQAGPVPDARPVPDAPPVPDADLTPDADLPDADLTPDADLPDATP